jgi:hypothetical protein
MKIVLVHRNYTVADLEGNATRIAQVARQAGERGADLVVTSELALLGYRAAEIAALLILCGYSWFEPLAEGSIRGPRSDLQNLDGTFAAVPAERLDRIAGLYGLHDVEELLPGARARAGVSTDLW